MTAIIACVDNCGHFCAELFAFPARWTKSKIAAEMKHGALTLTLLKAEVAKPPQSKLDPPHQPRNQLSCGERT